MMPVPIPTLERSAAIERWWRMHADRAVSFRPVTVADAPFVLKLRTNPDLNRHLSTVSHDLAAQESWLTGSMQRSCIGAEFYFIILHQSKPVGTVRLYDFNQDSFCWGSWIIVPGTPMRVALQSAAGVYEIGHHVLGFPRAHFEVRKDNASVSRFHRRMGAVLISEDACSYHYSIEAKDALATLGQGK
jgi:hypothetical protein